MALNWSNAINADSQAALLTIAIHEDNHNKRDALYSIIGILSNASNAYMYAIEANTLAIDALNKTIIAKKTRNTISILIAKQYIEKTFKIIDIANQYLNKSIRDLNISYMKYIVLFPTYIDAQKKIKASMCMINETLPMINIAHIAILSI